MAPPIPITGHPAVNLGASPRGAAVGGLGLVALAVLVTLVRPQAWWLVAFGALGGLLLGIALILVGRQRLLSRPRNGRSGVLFDRESG